MDYSEVDDFLNELMQPGAAAAATSATRAGTSPMSESAQAVNATQRVNDLDLVYTSDAWAAGWQRVQDQRAAAAPMIVHLQPCVDAASAGQSQSQGWNRFQPTTSQQYFTGQPSSWPQDNPWQPPMPPPAGPPNLAPWMQASQPGVAYHQPTASPGWTQQYPPASPMVQPPFGALPGPRVPEYT